jgi:membrane protein implicated in regulation of membrane protease activity
LAPDASSSSVCYIELPPQWAEKRLPERKGGFVAEEKKESASLAKPAEFFIGLVDFFAILLPGGLATAILLELADSTSNLQTDDWSSILKHLPTDVHWPAWIAFAVMSYLLGHFIFLVGSASLDNLYDLTYKLVNKDKDEADGLMRRSKTLLKGALSIREDEVQSIYQWARIYTRLRSPATSLEIDRFEADSKFFRSLTVLLFLSGFLLPAALSNNIGWIIFATLVVILCFVGAVLLGNWRKTDELRKKEREKYEEEIRQAAYELFETRLNQPVPNRSPMDDWLRAEATVFKAKDDASKKRKCRIAWTILGAAIFLQFVFYFSFKTWVGFGVQLASVACLALSGWRFMERRFKGVAFTYRLLLATSSETTSRPVTKPES